MVDALGVEGRVAPALDAQGRSDGAGSQAIRLMQTTLGQPVRGFSVLDRDCGEASAAEALGFASRVTIAGRRLPGATP